MKTNAIGWFEIPVTNMDRAVSFYQKVFDVKLHVEKMGPFLMGWFPHDEKKIGAGGALALHKDFYKPSTEGTLVYFYSIDVAIELSRVEDAGGQIIQEKTLISEEIGHMALFLDTEGNRVALYANA